MSESVINAAVADFIAEIIVKHGPEPKKVYCDKDPFNLRNFVNIFFQKFCRDISQTLLVLQKWSKNQSHMVYLSELFPNAKFIFMLRDGRASAHSGWFPNRCIKLVF